MKHAWNITKAQMNGRGGRKCTMTAAVGYSPWPRPRKGIPFSSYAYAPRWGGQTVRTLKSGIKSVATEWGS